MIRSLGPWDNLEGTRCHLIAQEHAGARQTVFWGTKCFTYVLHVCVDINCLSPLTLACILALKVFVSFSPPWYRRPACTVHSTVRTCVECWRHCRHNSRNLPPGEAMLITPAHHMHSTTFFTSLHVVRQRVPALSGNTWCLLSYPKVLVTLSSVSSNVHLITNSSVKLKSKKFMYNWLSVSMVLLNTYGYMSKRHYSNGGATHVRMEQLIHM